MSHSIIAFLFQLVFAVACGLQITAAVLLLRSGGTGSWLMLGGSVLALITHLSYCVIPHVYPKFGDHVENYFMLSGVTALGSMIFCIGLLLHALHCRAQGNRVAELETIIASIQRP